MTAEARTVRTAAVWVTLAVVIADDYPGDYIDLQADVSRVLDDTALTLPDGREVGRIAITDATSSTFSTVPVE